ncbi:galactosylgalactosylxylosylprotein 3-beta-glucuronosyltransferase 1-like isoform X3 [Megalops cyprinoides]|uniref:galactosylgalactosylxylosylprotein 3-beta-glucuronosyltransferase 1-like isoform X3 n=1 Tax=Megalops cyprinoides TaxID=118141 RepID=UPI001864726B|nr:galactosylgalactosylxylosylprotein 3-beta-glucuronosyltransferase 1-like isoform X3 [Megalops cyprinoides]
MPKRRDILAVVLIVLPWTLLITVWHQSAIAPLLAIRKACHHLVKEIFIIPERLAVRRHRPTDDTAEGHRDPGQGSDSKEYCSSDKDIVEVVRTEYVYTRPPPWSDVLPTIHVVTPTYSRPVQKAELTRLANTFLHVPNLHWILVEDSQRRTPLVSRLLHEMGLNYTHLNVETPRNYKLRGDTRDPRIPRGTMQRNLALRWLRETFSLNSTQPGIVYFADDDNTYSLELFEEGILFIMDRCETPVFTFLCGQPGRCLSGLWPSWVAYAMSHRRSTPLARCTAGRRCLTPTGPLPLTWQASPSTSASSSSSPRPTLSCVV